MISNYIPRQIGEHGYNIVNEGVPQCNKTLDMYKTITNMIHAYVFLLKTGTCGEKPTEQQNVGEFIPS